MPRVEKFYDDRGALNRLGLAGWKYIEELEAEIARLREELAAWENKHPESPPPMAVQIKMLLRENDRLREERDLQFDNVIALSNQRDTLLAALREWDEADRRWLATVNARPFDAVESAGAALARGLADKKMRAVISEVEGEK